MSVFCKKVFSSKVKIPNNSPVEQVLNYSGKSGIEVNGDTTVQSGAKRSVA